MTLELHAFGSSSPLVKLDLMECVIGPNHIDHINAFPSLEKLNLTLVSVPSLFTFQGHRIFRQSIDHQTAWKVSKSSKINYELYCYPR